MADTRIYTGIKAANGRLSITVPDDDGTPLNVVVGSVKNLSVSNSTAHYDSSSLASGNTMTYAENIGTTEWSLSFDGFISKPNELAQGPEEIFDSHKYLITASNEIKIITAKVEVLDETYVSFVGDWCIETFETKLNDSKSFVEFSATFKNSGDITVT